MFSIILILGNENDAEHGEREALLAKLDLESAYRMTPVHPGDLPLLDMKWKEQYMVEAALPISLQSVFKIFNAMADCLNWKHMFTKCPASYKTEGHKRAKCRRKE